MGKRSIKENKNVYQLVREELGLTREKASELLPGISSDRIEKIESGKSLPHPDEILIMAKGYKAPELCNRFCSGDCPIGQQYIPEIPKKDLSQITLDVLNSLHSLTYERDRFIEITVDGKISTDEYKDYLRIEQRLDEITRSVNSLKLWVDQAIARGGMDPEEMEQIRSELKNETEENS